MEKKLNWSKIQPLLGKWDKYLQPLFEDSRMYDLFSEIAEIAKTESFTPKNSNLFKFLEVCPPEELKLIIIGMDSYPSKYKNGELQATGIAFDCSNSPDDKIQPSLEYFYNGVSEDIGIELDHNKSLINIAKQGVLFGNRALNCKLNKTGSMMGKWDIFWDYFLTKVITPNFNGVPIMLLGKEAKVLRKYIFEMSNPVFELSHPSYAHRNQIPWDTKGYFKQINNIIKANNGDAFPIRWDAKISENGELYSSYLPWEH